MEVFTFSIEIERTRFHYNKNLTVLERFTNDIKNRTSDLKSFKKAWQSYNKKDIFALANKDDLLYSNNTSNYEYFVFKQSDKYMANKTNFAFDVIVIAENQIGDRLKEIINDINKLLSISLKIKNLTSNTLHIYTTNKTTSDIQNTDVLIETNITSKTLEISDIITLGIGGLILAAGLALYLTKNDFGEKLMIASIFPILIPTLKAIYYFFKKNYSIKIISAENLLTQQNLNPPGAQTLTPPAVTMSIP